MENFTLLDSIETTAQKPDSSQTSISPQKLPFTYREYLEPTFSEDLQNAIDLYSHIDNIEGSRHTESLSCCRQYAWFVRDTATNTISVASNSCKKRWCPFCSSTRRALITSEVSAWLKHCKGPKLLTLTHRHSDLDLTEQIDRLYDDFKKFRRHKLLKKSVRGGVWFFQVKRSKHDGLWHPHIHVLLDSNFMKHSQLSKIWYSTTKHSRIIDIRAIHDVDKDARHAARYGSQAASLVGLSLGQQLELYYALHGRRSISAFGNARKLSFRPKRIDDDRKTEKIANWSTIVNMIGVHDDADAIYKAWKTGEPLEAGISMRKIEKEIYNELELSLNEPRPPTYQLNFFDGE